MKIRSLSATLALLGLLVVTPGCKDFFDVNVDPLNPTTATEEQLLPGTQLAMATYLGFSLSGMGQATSTLVGQLNSSRGVGAFQQSGASFVNQWSGLYIDMLENNELIIQQTSAIIASSTATAEDKTDARGYLGIAQLQKAYVFSLMVDMWGDIPYSEALRAQELRAPRFDNDRDIYLGNEAGNIQGLFALIDEGLNNMQKSTSAARGDLIYGGDKTKWMAFGRTLKLKLYNQVRLVQNDPSPLMATLRDSVTALMSRPARLMQTANDFEFTFGSSIQPENRNVAFLSNYVNPNREDFVNQDFVVYMANRQDPRLNYYFYNQSNSGAVQAPVNQSVTGLTGRLITVPLGSTSNTAATANDQNITLPGLYPAGGRYNDGVFAGSTGANNTYGRGIAPQRLLTTYARYFTEAELQLTVLNDPAAAAIALRNGIDEAFRKVAAVAAADGPTTAVKGVSNTIPSVSPGVARVAAYTNAAVARFNSASTPERKLNVIMQEKYVASFGFGEDIWTDLRRTGYPNPDPNPETPVVRAGDYGLLARVPGEVPNTVASGSRPTILFYSQSDLTLNPNAPRQHDAGDLVFWDPN